MRLCSIEGCEKKHHAKGYCNSHYNQFVPTAYKGLFRSLEYRAWKHMKARCTNPNDKRYSSHGGRGITVCIRWEKFKNFYKDMGKRPNKDHSLDRIDNDGNYEPSNCRWATPSVQQKNKRTPKNNTSGYKGVYQKGDKWEVWIFHNKKRIYIGKFNNIDEAIVSRKQAELNYGK